MRALTPDLHEVVVLQLSGNQLHEALAHSIARLGSAPVDGFFDGRFLQLSSSLRYEWQLESAVPRIRYIQIGSAPTTRGGTPSGFAQYGPQTRYSVALPKFLAEGGDGYTMLRTAYEASRNSRTLPTLHFDLGLGIAVFDATSAYLGDATAVGALPTPTSGRITQANDSSTAHLGSFCERNASLAERVECKIVVRMVGLINDKTDGFLDELLPRHHIVLHEVTAAPQLYTRARQCEDRHICPWFAPHLTP